MRYLITYAEIHTPFLTEWFQAENHWQEGVGMVVYDLQKEMFTTDGQNWRELEKDCL